MTKTEVVFDGDNIKVNGYMISTIDEYLIIFNSSGSMVKKMHKELNFLEEVIQYCLEN